MPRSLRVLRWVGVVLALVLLAGALTAFWTVRRSFPKTDGTVEIDGLSAPVRVVRDKWGVPQLYADTSADLFFAQGYVQAQDRFFEMDFRRHITAGRLTELFGEDALKTDMFVRTLGWQRVAEQELPLLTPQTRGYLKAFSAGVNAYLSDHDGARLSLEYAVLGVDGVDSTPEEWTPVDSLAWLKAMAWNLGSNMTDEVARSLDAGHVSVRAINELYPPYPYLENRPIVTQGGIVDGVFEQDATGNGTRLPSRPPYLLPAHGALRDARDASAGLSKLLGTGAGLGSNAWAVSGEHTASGAPILANDPHLGASMPGIWYQMGLHCNQPSERCPFDVSGFTLAGVPGVVIGHNARVAWGFTNLYPDVQDLYLEKVLDGGRYLYNGHRRKLATREETFEVDGRDDPVTITVRETRHGPLISDVSRQLSTVGANAPTGRRVPRRGNGYAVALRWTALAPGRTAEALFALDQAHDWESFRDAARNFEVPSQNLVYADVDGHIGYQAPGHIPIRRTGNGEWPVPGWDPAYEWDDDYVPFDALPSVLDPDDGYVVTANQAITGPDYPYFIGSSFDYGYRAQRIRTLLQGRDRLTVDDMSVIQLDDFSLLAKELTPRLLALRMPSDYYRAGQRTLARWDHHMDADSAGAAYFNVVWRNLLDLTLSDQLPEDARPDGGSRWWRVMLLLMDDPDNAFWDDLDTDDEVETRDAILMRAMVNARDELTRIRSRTPSDWRWGQLHTLTLRNETLGSDDSSVAFLFNRGGYELSGGPSIVNASSWNASKGYEATAVPSMRMVIPLDDLDGARWINLTGASGHAYNGHYTDQTDLWAEGKTLPWYFSSDAVERAGDKVLTLKPAP